MVSNLNRRITRRAFHLALPLLALGGGIALSPRGIKVSAFRDLSELLETQRQREALPAVAAAIIHRGANNSWYALVWIAPERNSAFLCTTNIGGHSIFPKIDAVISSVIQDHLHNFGD